MTITTSPQPLSLLSNLAPITIAGAEADVTLTLHIDQGDHIMTHTYSPNDGGTIEVQLRDILRPLLTIDLRDGTEPYRQATIARTFRVTVTENADTPTTTAITFTALRAGIDRFDGDAQSFLTQNFLTWQPNTKRVTYYTPEFLTYYATVAARVRCRAYIAMQDGDPIELTFTLHTIPAGQCHTIPTQYAAILAALRSSDPYTQYAASMPGETLPLPSYYDVWVENASGERLTYIQRYIADTLRTDEEQWVLFENSLGGIDTFRAYGDSENTAAHTHNVAEIEETLHEYRVDTERTHRKSTGHLNARERLWLLDFFPSTGKYICLPTSGGTTIIPIVVTESDVTYNAATLPTAYTFTYRHAQDRPLLNLPRAEQPQEAVNITPPADDASFTLAPRLAEFPRLALSGGALLPIQSPYAQAWAVTSLTALADYLIQNITTNSIEGGLGHTHNNIDLLNRLAYTDGYLSVDGQKTKASRADIATEAEDLTADSPAYGRFLRKDIADTAARLITLLQGTIHGDPADPEAIIGNAEEVGNVGSVGEVGEVGSPTSPTIPTIPTIPTTPTSYIRSLLAPLLRSQALAAAAINATDITTHDLTVTGMAHFFELVIDKIRATAGAQIITPATGFKVAEVLPLDIQNPLWTEGSSLPNAIDGKRLFFRSQDSDGNAIHNMWKVGDQALCRNFNHATPGVSYNLSNKYYWALVCGTDNNGDGTSTPVIREIDGVMVPCHYIDIYCGTGEEIPEERPTDANGIPLWDGDPTQAAAGDEVAMLGYRGTGDSDRQSAIYLSAYASTDNGLVPPFIAFYQGVDDFDLPSHRKTYADARGTRLYGTFISTSSNQETEVESLLSGTEFDIIYGEGDPNDPGNGTAPDDPNANTLYYDTSRTPASTGGRMWKWTVENGSGSWVQVTDVDTLAALERVNALHSEIEQMDTQIALRVTRGEMVAAGITIDGENETVTIDGAKTAITGDLDIKGLITESSQFIDWWHPTFSTPTDPSVPLTPSTPPQPDDFVGSALFIPIDLTTTKSVSVSPTSREGDGTGAARYGATALVCLPMYNAASVNGAQALPAHRLSGTHLTIRNVYSPFYAHWQQLQDSGKFDALNGAVLICADPRILCADNFTGNTAAIPVATGGYDEARAHGNMVCQGRRAKFLLLMPGQGVELVSSVEQYGTDINGTYGTIPYLTWYVVGDTHQPMEAELTFDGTDSGGNAISHTAHFHPTATGIAETASQGGDTFLAPPQLTPVGNTLMQLTITTHHGHKPTAG